MRTTVSEIGPVLMARLLQLNATQEGVLNIVFKVADEQGLLLLDFKDLQAMLQWTAENAGTFTTRYGNVSKQTVGIIQRALLTLEQQGGERFFGEPALDLKDMIGVDASGVGTINVLAADKLMESPKLYSTFLLWLLSELFEVMPEVGDVEKPKFVFFFDEAHLLFDDAPKALLDKIEQVVRLIRSKGVGIYFISQNPLDIPESVLGQLSNRVQHALRAFTPRDQKAVKDGGRDVPAEQEVLRRRGDRRARRRRGAGLVPRRQGRADAGRALLRRAAARPDRSGDRRRARRRDRASPLAGKYEQEVDREFGLRGADGPRHGRPAPARGAAGDAEHRAAPARPVRCAAADPAAARTERSVGQGARSGARREPAQARTAPARGPARAAAELARCRERRPAAATRSPRRS